MIKENELRVGNYIADYEEKENYFKIEQIRINSIGDYVAVYRLGSICCQVNLLEPIPLTEEILLKCGFENEVDDIDGKMYNIYFVTNTEYLIEYFYKEKEYIFTDDMGLKIYINSIHQLQNLYYALTNEELQINL